MSTSNIDTGLRRSFWNKKTSSLLALCRIDLEGDHQGHDAIRVSIRLIFLRIGIASCLVW